MVVVLLVKLVIMAHRRHVVSDRPVTPGGVAAFVIGLGKVIIQQGFAPGEFTCTTADAAANCRIQRLNMVASIRMFVSGFLIGTLR